MRERIQHMVPSYFSIVMATGILGVAFSLEGWKLIAEAILLINALFFVGLVAALLYRLRNFMPAVMADLHSYQRAPGFLTFIPACCIMGNQFVLVYGAISFAKVLLVLAGGVWFVMAYGLYFNLTITDHKESLKDGINGSWLLFVVALQAISVLITLTARNDQILLFSALCFFALGAIFYLYIMSLIIYRMSFFELHAAELGAPYWINMGATAITALAASMLILSADKFPLIKELIPFLKGIAIMFWAAGTWWIPLLIMLGIWKHVIKKTSIPTSAAGYDASYWSLVFPLGMYTVSTLRLSVTLNLPFLGIISHYFIFIVGLAWLSVFAGFIKRLMLILKNQF